MVVDINGGAGIGKEYSLLQPVVQITCRPGIAAVPGAVLRILAPVFDTHEIVRTAPVKLILKVGIDDIIRRADDIRQFPHPGSVVVHAVKGLNLSHL
jgi:hypothetical protein